ncbi:hypothetical protein HY772_02185 [Candidatus Woesearchaeota archaeon]|nr:hypothetical protein [Candidatus Woesearchaeota archaeon]
MPTSTANAISETPITMTELKAELENVRTRDAELNFRAQKTEEYLQQFTLLDKKEADELSKKIAALDIPRLKADHIVKLIDIFPTDPEEVKAVLQGTTVTVSKDNLKRIADLVAEFKK